MLTRRDAERRRTGRVAQAGRATAGGVHAVPLRAAVRVWAAVGLQSFGGPAGQIALMHRRLVEELRWISERRFLHALNFCMLLPGPEAQQLAVYVGWLLNGTVGGVLAGVLFVLPGVLALLALSIVYAVAGDVGVVTGVLFGLQAAVVAIVADAVLRIGRRALTHRVLVGLAGAAFIGIFVFELPFPLIVLAAAVTGYAGGRRRPAWFAGRGGHGSPQATGPGERAVLSDAAAQPSLERDRRARRAALVCLALWAAPVAAVLLLVGAGHVFGQQAVLFSQTAVVTFGGAYAVLGYVAQRAVEDFGWLRPEEMTTGLGLAETTPGPLILVVQFVGFQAAYRNPGSLDPLLAGVLGSLLVVWVTFLPCFLFIFAGAPYIERLRGHLGLRTALAAVTAAVVGVILNLAVWFALHTAFDTVEETRRGGARLLVPEPASIDVASVSISVAAAVALLRLRWGVLRTLVAAAAGGLALHLLTGAGG
jgi:chromate transporter